jgi:hypothetical protein
VIGNIARVQAQMRAVSNISISGIYVTDR